MSKTIKLQPRTHHRLLGNLDAVFLGVSLPGKENVALSSTHRRLQLQKLINQWLAISCFCFALSLCFNFILNF